MKIQFYGQKCFRVSTKEATFIFDPYKDSQVGEADFVLCSSGDCDFERVQNAKKVLSLPGEFEISGALVRGFFSDTERKNVVFKVVSEDISVVHFGTLSSVPDPDFLKKLGENIDILFLNLSSKFSPKEAKSVIENIDPRMVLIGGDASLFPKMVESGARMVAENAVSLSHSELLEEKLDILILTVA